MMYKEYEVTITPKITTYAGSSTFGEYTVTVTAKSHADALKQARADRRESEGRYGVPATFRAKLIK
jgi:hypothetical protein